METELVFAQFSVLFEQTSCLEVQFVKTAMLFNSFIFTLNICISFITRQEETLNKSVGEGKIFYQPDEADDFDEEDPDDDLDI